MGIIPPLEAQAWRDGDLLVLTVRDPRAPTRCMISNRPIFGLGPYRKKHGWAESHSKIPLVPLYVKLLFGLAVMRFITVEVSLSDEERAKRAFVLRLSFACFCASCGILAYGAMLGFPPHFEFMLPGVLIGIMSITIFMNKYSLVHVVRIDSRFVWLRGAGAVFLDSLPKFEASPNRG